MSPNGDNDAPSDPRLGRDAGAHSRGGRALIVRDGLAAVGVNALAREAGCDKVLIYRYFGDLDGVYAAFAAQSDFWWTRRRSDRRASTRRERRSAEALKTIFAATPRRCAAAGDACRARRRADRTHAAGRRARGGARTARAGAMAWIGARYRLPPALDLAAIAMLLGVAVNYLAVRARTIRVMSGVKITSDADWERMFAADRRADRRRFARPSDFFGPNVTDR